MKVVARDDLCFVFEHAGDFYIKARCQDGFMERSLFIKIHEGEGGLYKPKSSAFNLLSLGKEIAGNYKNYKSREITEDLLGLAKEAVRSYNTKNT